MRHSKTALIRALLCIVSLTILFFFIKDRTQEQSNIQAKAIDSQLTNENMPADQFNGWVPYEDNPVLFGDAMHDTAWNDPCVIIENNKYIMYFTRNISIARTEPTAMIRAVSKDGIKWDIDPNIMLGPSDDKMSFDYNKVETPSVIKYKDKYHLFYCGLGENYRPFGYRLGHATSNDGIHWLRDRNNPILRPEFIVDAGKILHIGEPGAVVYENRIYLYFVVTAQPYEKSSQGKIMIYLATSTDGSTFDTPRKVMEQGSTYPAELGYVGYSTSNALVFENKIHLFYDVYQNLPENGIAENVQVAINHAVSDDGLLFIEDNQPIFASGDFSWTTREIRSPCVIHDGDKFKMWFAGDNYDIINDSWVGGMGIGYAEANAVIYKN